MKKSLFVLFVVMVSLLTACGGTGESKFYGTWTVVSMEDDKMPYTAEALEAMGDDSLSDFYIIIKEGGTAYAHMGGEGSLIDWEISSNGIVVGIREATLSNGLLTMENDGLKVVFEKTSNDQTFPASDD